MYWFLIPLGDAGVDKMQPLSFYIKTINAQEASSIKKKQIWFFTRNLCLCIFIKQLHLFIYFFNLSVPKIVCGDWENTVLKNLKNVFNRFNLIFCIINL